MSNKNEFIEVCESELSIPIFLQPWWLDLASDFNWDVSLARKGGQIVGVMPYSFKRYLGNVIVRQPPLTQAMGPWLKSGEGKYCKRLARENEILGQLIDGLPKTAHFSQSWSYKNQNWLPFYWAGFRQTTRYTYVINDISDLDKVWEDFQENVRREVRKARKIGVRIRTDLPLYEFIKLNSMTFQRQNIPRPYSVEYLTAVIEAAVNKGQCKWFIGQGKDSRNHAGVLIVWDSARAYYLVGGGDPDLRNSGATSLCMWEAIQYASKHVNEFDFEGSMRQKIERFFRGFGAIQTPYHSVSKTDSVVLRGLISAKSLRQAHGK